MVFESQWFLMKLKRLPRGINAVILATAYHPPSSNDSLLRAHFFQNLDLILFKFPNSAIIIMGDFNQFNTANLCSSFKLKKVVTLPTRGNNILDQVYSTLSQYYLNAQILPPIGMSDHSCILISPCNCTPKSYPTTHVFKRLSRPSNKLSLSTSLSSNNWTSLYRATSIHDKFDWLSATISENINIHLPLRSVKSHPMDKPWMNANITEAIAIRQSAWTNGQTPKYNSFRNKVTKMCRHARRQFYNSMVDHTQAFNPRKWWKNVKLLAGLPKSKPLTKLSHNGQVLRGQELVNHMCECFCTATNDIPPLNFNQLPVSSIPDKYIISPEQVEAASPLGNVKHDEDTDEDVSMFTFHLQVGFINVLCSLITALEQHFSVQFKNIFKHKFDRFNKTCKHRFYRVNISVRLSRSLTNPFRNRSSSFSVGLPRSACAIVSTVSVFPIKTVVDHITDQQLCL